MTIPNKASSMKKSGNNDQGRRGRSQEESLFLNSRQPATFCTTSLSIPPLTRTSSTSTSSTVSTISCSSNGTASSSSRTSQQQQQQQRMKKRLVRFSTVEVREMPIIAGDVGCFLAQGPPITLDWQPFHTWKTSVGAMEMDRKEEQLLRASTNTSPSSFNNNEALIAPLSAERRHDLLLQQGVSPADIQQATISAQFLNQQRWETRLLDQLEAMKSQ